MGSLSVAKNYLLWHYTTAYIDILYIWRNYFWFINHLFSVPEVAMSLFAPFKRITEETPNVLMHPEDFFSGLFVNLIMRLVGFMLRASIIVIALLCFMIVLIGGVLFLLLWTILPVLVVHYLVDTIRFLFM